MLAPASGVLFHYGPDAVLGPVYQHGGADSLTALQDAKHYGFSASVPTVLLDAGLAVLMHVAGAKKH